MAGSPDTLEQQQHEVCNAFARVAVAMRDAAHTAENFSNWFSRVNNIQNISVPPMLNGSYNFTSSLGGPQQHQSSEPEQTGKKRKASGDQESKSKRPAKERKQPDPNAPKRPPSAYLLFQNEIRKVVKENNPEMPYAQVLAEISKLWKGMSPEEKAPYMQATADSKVMYDKAKADYDAQGPAEAKQAQEVSKRSSTSKSKAPIASSAMEKPAVKPITTSDDSDDDDNEHNDDDDDESSSSSSDDSSSSKSEPAPEPPRKKSKKEAVKALTPPPTKVEKKKKPEDGKKKKKNDT